MSTQHGGTGRFHSLTSAVMMAALLWAGPGLVSAAQNEDTASNAPRRVGVIEVEVSENANRFIFDETPLTQDPAGNQVPGDGNEFKTEGYVYERGTLDGDGDGVNPDGSPQYPERVIGRWTCWGYHVGNGGATETGPWVITHQLFDFGEKFGERSIVTAGLELVDVGAPIARAITGGTGPYKHARGEAVQTMIGFNSLKGVNLRVALQVSKH
jgi:hypothetical protein